MKTIINVGILDDDQTKRTQLMAMLTLGVDAAPEEVQRQYSDYELNPVELDITTDVKGIVDQIIEKEIDVLLLDYQLSSFVANVDFTGVSVAVNTNNKFLNFPVFILTSFEDELYKHEVFDAYKVFDFERYMSDEAERIELNRKIIEQYRMRKKELAEKQDELYELLKHGGESQQITNRILELDDYIEKSLDGETAISSEDKKRFLYGEYDEVISLLKKITEGENN